MAGMALPGFNLILVCRRSNLCFIHVFDFWNREKIRQNYNVERTQHVIISNRKSGQLCFSLRMPLLMTMIEFGCCTFSSWTGNQHHGHDGGPSGARGQIPRLVYQHWAVSRSRVLGMVKDCVSPVRLSSRQLHLTWRRLICRCFRLQLR